MVAKLPRAGVEKIETASQLERTVHRNDKKFLVRETRENGCDTNGPGLGVFRRQRTHTILDNMFSFEYNIATSRFILVSTGY
jgi:hypothetical protein